MRLIDDAGKYTSASRVLRSAAMPEGILVEGERDRAQPAFAGLLARGWIEPRRSGPHKGIRYHATQAGLTALRCADLAMQAEYLRK